MSNIDIDTIVASNKFAAYEKYTFGEYAIFLKINSIIKIILKISYKLMKKIKTLL